MHKVTMRWYTKRSTVVLSDYIDAPTRSDARTQFKALYAEEIEAIEDSFNGEPHVAKIGVLTFKGEQVA
jgi:hypothetical protein